MRRRRGKVEDEDPGEGKGRRTKMMRTDMYMTRRASGG